MRITHAHTCRILVVLLILVAGTIVSADRIRLRSGKVIEGTLTGADASTVRLLLANGTRADVPVADIAGIDFTSRTPAPPPAPPSPARAPAAVTVPAKTMLNVRLTEGIDVDATKAGATFRSLVDDPVMLDGKVVIPRGAVVIVQAASVAQSGAMKGSDKISLKANTITLGGVTYEIVTAYVETKGGGRREKDRTKNWRRRWPGRHRRRHCRRRRGRGDWCGGGSGDWRHRRQPGQGAPAVAGRDTAAVSVDRSGHDPAIGRRRRPSMP